VSEDTLAKRQVVVTGLGVVCATAHNLREFSAALREGRSGTGLVQRFETDWFSSRVGAEVRDYDFDAVLSPSEQRHHDRLSLLAFAAAREAIGQAGLTDAEPSDRSGVVIGTGMGPSQSWAEGFTDVRLKQKKPRPTIVPRSMFNAPAGQLAIRHGLRGPSQTIVTACASSAHAIASGMDYIRYGRADLILVGGVETLPCYESWAAWDTLRVMARDNERPAAASRPFAIDRTGFVMAEAAAMLVLEADETARARGARIYGEVVGAGLSTDANHITAPSTHGLVSALRGALDDAEVRPEEVEYINAHGTGTPLNDPTEVAAIKELFGEQAYRLAVSSTKSSTGHTIGAAGAIEAVATLIGLDEGFIPPTLNLDEPDPQCDLDHVPHTAREARFDTALSNSFAFGGHNVVLVLRRYRG